MQSNLSGQLPHNRTKNHLKPLKIGVIGVGNMGRHHVRVLSLLKDTELVGVADANLERGIEIASKYNIKTYHLH